MSETDFTFIHAADLHLGAGLSGLSREAGELAGQVEGACYAALDNLLRLALEEKPDAVLLAGDNYNREQGSAKALLSLRDACAALGRAGVSVFMVHGNHDPLSQRDVLAWPDNVHVFGKEAVESRPILRNGKALALVHGISHGRREETANLAARFRRAPGELFQIGLLHCQAGSQTGHLPYAPCSLADLSGSGLDYWALGHVHKRTQVSSAPPAYYPGNLQGLHINEDGPKGCLLVRVRGRQLLEVAFRAVNPVQWEKLTLSLQGMDKLDALEERVREAMSGLASEAEPQVRGFLLRLTLTGATELNADLRGPWGGEMLERLREWGKAQSPFLWLKDIRVETSPAMDLGDLLARDDLLGETLRRLREMGAEPVDMAPLLEGPLSELYGPRAVQARAAGLPPPAAEELPDLLKAAAFACLARLSPPVKP